MAISISDDLISAFNNLIINLKPYAQKQNVILDFKSEIDELLSINNQKELILQFSNVISKIINYTPQSHTVNIFLQYDPIKLNVLIINISNTGANLSRIREITNDINYKLEVIGIENSKTNFIITLPLKKVNKLFSSSLSKINLGHTPYYKEIENKLTAYFKEIENLQAAADDKGEKEGDFLRNVNAIIQSRMNNNEFKVNALASSMALSRAQLFRKMKALTKMSPSEYLLYFRLLVARDLIETKSKSYNISEIGYKVGFISKSHFTRSFQKQFGISPSNYNK